MLDSTSARATFVGPATSSSVGDVIKMGGDVNSDGISDMLLSTPSHAPYSTSNVGRVSIVLGGQHISGVIELENAGESTMKRWHLMPVIDDDDHGTYFGSDCAFVGDLDGDGEEDVFVGAWRARDDSGNLAGLASLYTMSGGVFTNESVGTGMEYFGTPYASAQIDYDGDTLVDLMITRSGGYEGLVYRQTGSDPSGAPEMSEVGDAALGAVRPGSQRGIAVADYDNDGAPDMFVAHETSPKLYRNAGDGTFEDATAALGADAGGSLARESWAGAWGDYNKDGFLDMFISKGGSSATPSAIGTRNVMLLESRLTYFEEEFADVTTEAGLGSVVMGSVAAQWTDIRNGTRGPDLVVGSLKAGDPSKYFASTFDASTGSYGFVDLSTQYGIGYDQVSAIAQGGANPSDGYLDIAVSRRSDLPGEQNLILLENTGWGPYVDVTGASGIETKGRYSGVTFADFNLDGQSDLMGFPNSGQKIAVLENDDYTFRSKTVGAGLWLSAQNVNGAVVCDFNGDGDLDLYLGRGAANPETAKFYYQNRPVFFDEAPDEKMHWLKIRLECSDAYNRMGIGSRVVYYDGYSEYQAFIVDGGGGGQSQGSPEITIGLGEEVANGKVFVYWPDGRLSVFQGLEAMTDNTTPLILRDEHVNVEIQDFAVTVFPLPGNLLEWEFQWKTPFATPVGNDVVTIEIGTCPGLPSQITIDNATEVEAFFDGALSSGKGFVHRYRVVTPCTPTMVGFKCSSTARVWNASLGDWENETATSTKLKKVTVPGCFQ